jgi:light-harvesting protein B-800-850 alpha chain
MNHGRIWTVVKLTVGLPLFLGSVAVIAILVHLALLSYTTWFPKYWNGKTAAIESSVNVG